jgi:ABC-type branched-subunit amino acid transport system substrate-binding protein
MRDTIKVGVIADQTGALAPLGGAQANTATLVVDEINASGGVLGHRVELLLEDSASDDAQAAAAATKLVQDEQVDVLLGGIFSSTRQAIKEPAVVEGETLYICASGGAAVYRAGRFDRGTSPVSRPRGVASRHLISANGERRALGRARVSAGCVPAYRSWAWSS